MSGVFTQDTTTNNKRAVRGEFWRSAFEHLHRAGVRHPYVVTLAGRNPSEELAAIRLYCPRAHVTLVDKDEEAFHAAVQAGADDVFYGDIFAWTEMPWMKRAHVINLDLCGQITDQVVRGASAYGALVKARRGVLGLTISYGREPRKYVWKSYKGLPSVIGGRVEVVDREMSLDLSWVKSYKGNKANMCTMTWRDRG